MFSCDLFWAWKNVLISCNMMHSSTSKKLHKLFTSRSEPYSGLRTSGLKKKVPVSGTSWVSGSPVGGFWENMEEFQRRRRTPDLQWTRKTRRRIQRTETDSQTVLWGQETCPTSVNQVVLEEAEGHVGDGPTCCPQRACWIYLSSLWCRNVWVSPWDTKKTITNWDEGGWTET